MVFEKWFQADIGKIIFHCMKRVLFFIFITEQIFFYSNFKESNLLLNFKLLVT